MGNPPYGPYTYGTPYGYPAYPYRYPPQEKYAADGSSDKNDLSKYNEHDRDYRTPSDKWQYSPDRVGEGYAVYSDRLEQIAKKMEEDLKDLESALNKVITAGPVSTLHVGDTIGGREFVRMIDNAHKGFSQYYKELMDGYRVVISNLYKSAGEYKKAEEYSTPKYQK